MERCWLSFDITAIITLHFCVMYVGTLPKATRSPSPKDPEASSDSESEEVGGGKEYSGEIEIPNLSEENDMDEIDVCVNV